MASQPAHAHLSGLRAALRDRGEPARRVLPRALAGWERLARAPRSRLGFDSSRRNNFDALRLLAAGAVLVSHSFAIAGSPQPSVGALDLGSIGVIVFFGISGFLIAQSWTWDPAPRRFLAKRVLRIMPALLVLLLLTVLVMGPAISSLGPAAYLESSATWLYLVKNALLATTHELPGVFTTLEYPRQVNASLWTLQLEAIAYIAVLAAGLAGLLTRMWVAPVVAIVLVVAPYTVAPWTSDLFVLQAFAVGTSLYLLRDRIPWHPAIVAVALVVWALAFEGLQMVLTVAVIPYAAIFVAYRGPTWLRRLTTRGDFSYGLYLFAWPVGQLTALAWGGDISPGWVIVVSLPVAYLIAMASWRWVESPALQLKRRLGRSTTEPRVERPADDTPVGAAFERGFAPGADVTLDRPALAGERPR